MTELLKNGFVVCKEYLDKASCEALFTYTLEQINNNISPEFLKHEDPTIKGNVYDRYGDKVYQEILYGKIPYIEELLNNQVFPTYQVCRIYKKGSGVTPHIDREPCEIGVSMFVGNTSDVYKSHLFIKNYQEETCKVELSRGDAVIYMGCELEHWRSPIGQESQEVPLEGVHWKQIQAFFHYVRKGFPHEKYAYDSPGNFRSTDSWA
tara:strand:- start:18141 stop:18761 length:621 start_codon:yes stop_codon:yes gene_type:complete